MKSNALADFVLAVLFAVAACGRAPGKDEAPASNSQATGAADADDSGDSPDQVPFGTPTSDANTPDCSALFDSAVGLISAASSASSRECGQDADCMLYKGTLDCVYGCGYRDAVADPSKLDSAFDDAQTLCPPACAIESPPCVGQVYKAACVGGQCQLLENVPGGEP